MKLRDTAFIDILRDNGLQTLYYNALYRADVLTLEQVKTVLINKGKKNEDDPRNIRLIGLKGLKELKRIYEAVTGEVLDISFEHEKMATMLYLTESEIVKLKGIAAERDMDVSNLVRTEFNL